MKKITKQLNRKKGEVYNLSCITRISQKERDLFNKAIAVAKEKDPYLSFSTTDLLRKAIINFIKEHLKGVEV